MRDADSESQQAPCGDVVGRLPNPSYSDGMLVNTMSGLWLSAGVESR